MKSFIQVLNTILLVCIGLTLNSCGSSDDDCMKTIIIPQFYTIGNQVYSTEGTLEVPCDAPDPVVAQQIEPPFLANFSYQILFFEFTPDTGNNTRRLRFDIQLNNNSSAAVTGQPISTIVTDGMETTGNLLVAQATEPCRTIAANSSCVFSVDFEESLNLGMVDSIEITNVQYLLTDN